MQSRDEGQQPVYHLVTSTHQTNSTYFASNNHQRETSPSTIMSVRKLPKKRKYDPAEIEEPVNEAKHYPNQVKS